MQEEIEKFLIIMENKVLYNLDKIISVYVYKKKVNR